METHCATAGPPAPAWHTPQLTKEILEAHAVGALCMPCSNPPYATSCNGHGWEICCGCIGEQSCT